MKYSKIFFGLAAAGISLACGACGDGDANKALVHVTEHVIFQEVMPDENVPNTDDCCQNMQMCQASLIFATIMLIEKQKTIDILQQIIAEKQQTIDTHEATIGIFNKQASRELEQREVLKAKLSEQ